MKTMIFAAVAALEPWHRLRLRRDRLAHSQYLLHPTSGVTAKTPAQTSRRRRMGGRWMPSHQSSRGTWLFAPNQNGDGTNN